MGNKCGHIVLKLELIQPVQPICTNGKRRGGVLKGIFVHSRCFNFPSKQKMGCKKQWPNSKYNIIFPLTIKGKKKINRTFFLAGDHSVKRGQSLKM